MMQFLMSSLQASARPDCGGQRRIGVEGKSKYCLRWKLLKTGGESKASRSTALSTDGGEKVCPARASRNG